MSLNPRLTNRGNIPASLETPIKRNARRISVNFLSIWWEFTYNKNIYGSMYIFFCKIESHLQQLMPNFGAGYNSPSKSGRQYVLLDAGERKWIAERIKSSNPRKSCDTDNIDARLVQLCHAAFAENSTKYSISQEKCTRFCCALLCCGYAIIHNEFTWSIYPYSSGLLCWHWGNR